MRPEKQQLVSDIREVIEPADGVFFITYKGLTVDDFDSLRIELESAGATCRVVPNRLTMRAVEELGLASPADFGLSGDTAMVATATEPVNIAKLLKDFGKKNNNISMKGGFLAGKLCSPEQTEELAMLPTKDVLQAQLLGILQGAPRGLVSVLSAKVASIVYVLQAYRDKQEQAAS